MVHLLFRVEPFLVLCEDALASGLRLCIITPYSPGSFTRFAFPCRPKLNLVRSSSSSVEATTVGLRRPRTLHTSRSTNHGSPFLRTTRTPSPLVVKVLQCRCHVGDDPQCVAEDAHRMSTLFAMLCRSVVSSRMKPLTFLKVFAVAGSDPKCTAKGVHLVHTLLSTQFRSVDNSYCLQSYKDVDFLIPFSSASLNLTQVHLVPHCTPIGVGVRVRSFYSSRRRSATVLLTPGTRCPSVRLCCPAYTYAGI